MSAPNTQAADRRKTGLPTLGKILPWLVRGKGPVHTVRLFIFIFGMAVLGLSQIKSLQLWQRGEGPLLDSRYAARGAKPADPDIQVVSIQDSTLSLDALAPEEIAASPVLQAMQNPWPWDRRVYAAVLDKLFGAGAKVVVLDIVFAGGHEGDDVFAQALQKYRDRVVIGSMISSTGDKYFTPAPGLLPAGGQDMVGFVNLWLDSDGVARRGVYRTSLERESPVMMKLRGDVFPPNLMHMTALAVKKFAGRVQPPPDDHDNLIDFQGPQGTYESLPLENLFVDSLWQRPPFRGGIIFSNKIVIVGPGANVFQDIHRTPFGQMDGSEIQAQMMATLLRNSSIKDLPAALDVPLMVLMVLLAVMVCVLIPSAWRQALSLAVVTAIFYEAGRVAFVQYNLAVPMMEPLFGLLATGIFGIVCQYVVTQYDRGRYLNILERYVSKNVAKVILDDRRPFEESLSGRKRPVAMLFGDIRGFTTLAANIEPEQLVAQLNEYFTGMVDIVLESDGTLQKFIGDALFAAWGDTHSDGEKTDAVRAVGAALQMRTALAKLNSGWTEKLDRIRLEMGIGINHGEVIVGNVGHPRRMEFTLLGDEVNLTSRLESATKQYQTDILVSANIQALTKDQFIYRLADRLAIAGRNQLVDVYVLLGDRSQLPPAWLDRYHSAVKQFHDREFPGAIAGFEALDRELGGDHLCQLYLQRCNEFVQNSPPQDWDGATHWTKRQK